MEGKKEGTYLRLVVDRDESLHGQLIRNALDGYPTPLDFAYKSLALPEPEQAWRIVTAAVERFGANERPVFDSDELATAVELVGWRDICHASSESVRLHFLRCYVTLVARRVRDDFQAGRLDLFPPEWGNAGNEVG